MADEQPDQEAIRAGLKRSREEAANDPYYKAMRGGNTVALAKVARDMVENPAEKQTRVSLSHVLRTLYGSQMQAEEYDEADQTLSQLLGLLPAANDQDEWKLARLGEFAADAAFAASDLRLWSSLARATLFAVGPPDSPRNSNPTLFPTCSIATLYPNLVVANDLETGSPIWRLRVPKYVGRFVVPSSDIAFLRTTNSVYAIDPKSGERLWQFTPRKISAEAIYANPVVDGRGLLVGDRDGRLYRLDIETGEQLWGVDTPRSAGRCNGVIDDALVIDGSAIVSNISGRLSSYDVADGKLRWSTDIGEAVKWTEANDKRARWFWGMRSIALVDVDTGTVLQKFDYADNDIMSVALAGDTLCVAISPPGDRPHRGERGRLIGLRGGVELWSLPYPEYTSADLLFAEKPGYLFESTSMGLGIVDPVHGRRLAQIHSACQHRLDHRNDRVSVPAYRDDRIYIVDNDGCVQAWRDPLTR